MNFAEQVNQHKERDSDGFHLFTFMFTIPFTFVSVTAFSEKFPILTLQAHNSAWSVVLFITFLSIIGMISSVNIGSLWIVFRILKPTSDYIHNGSDTSIEAMIAKSLLAPFLVVGMFLSSFFFSGAGFVSLAFVLILSGVFALVCSSIVFVTAILNFSTILYRKSAIKEKPIDQVLPEKQVNAVTVVEETNNTNPFYVSKSFANEWTSLQQDVNILRQKEIADIELEHYVSVDLEKLAHVMQLFDTLTPKNKITIQEDIQEMFTEAKKNVQNAIFGVEQGVLLEIRKTKELMKR